MITPHALTEDEVEILLSAAVHAPSIHLSQSWRIELEGPVVDFLLDPGRPFPVQDPAGRLVRIGLGAAAMNVRVAAGMLGHETTFAIQPDPGRPEVAARIFLSQHRGPVTELGHLYCELHRRHTCRGQFLPNQVPAGVVAQLADVARSERAELHVLDNLQRTQLAQTLQAAPDATLLAVLSTKDEDEHAWLWAGMALEKLLLLATSYDLAASFLNQPLERTAHRAVTRALIGGRRWPQVILRLGYPARTPHQSLRRDRQETLDQSL
ncbi:hypothetical protein FB561_5784 [Kribbella amoyensis]|uniref:Nitroreductase family protein n=1 Tax=Kribbella amoyensis TaxID=996641 RepID=A0A561C0C5_9ACTN|nr:hypothetical protein [Kribbella amoyensis]TWD84591.1 hypothetical protein FB561_5784 [Kribbella amoyensis]